jgi:hypothetical protein
MYVCMHAQNARQFGTQHTRAYAQILTCAHTYTHTKVQAASRRRKQSGTWPAHIHTCGHTYTHIHIHRCGLPLADATEWHVACQFADDLPCPLAEAVERLCGIYLRAQRIQSFSEVWETDDPIRYMLKRGLAPKEPPPPTVTSLQSALEDMLPSDPEGYTVSGNCVAVHYQTQSESHVTRELRIKAAPPGGLVALLARHMSEERISANLRYVALLWSEFVNEVRWFWEQGIRIPRMPPDGDDIDRGSCLLHQKLQVRLIDVASEVAGTF